jgi:putative chitinase
MSAIVLTNKYQTILNEYEINTPLRLAHFWGQLHHESNLKPINENLNYSATGLLKIFPKYFNEKTANLYARQPQKIANKVYSNRMGNGDEKSGDGWKYRGKGFIQITGKSNYQLLSKDLGIDYINYPEKLLNEADALISALWFWKKNGLNKLADTDNVLSITKKINGGTNGLSHRTELLLQYKKEFCYDQNKISDNEKH